MKLYLIVIIVLLLLIAILCKEKPQVTENFRGELEDQKIKSITNIFTEVDKNKNKITDLNEIKRRVEEGILKQANKKLSLTPKQKNNLNKMLINKINRYFLY